MILENYIANINNKRGSITYLDQNNMINRAVVKNKFHCRYGKRAFEEVICIQRSVNINSNNDEYKKLRNSFLIKKGIPLHDRCIIFESDSPEAVKKMIGANMGIGFWPSFSWGKLNSKNVKLLEITSPQCSRDILISYKKNKLQSARVEKFYKFLCEYFNRHSS